MALERDLAREALRLMRSDDLRKVVYQMHEIIAQLDAHHWLLGQSDQENEKWLRLHPITQLLAHKIKNLACDHPEHSFRRAELMVERLAEVDDGCEATVGSSNIPLNRSINGRGDTLSAADDEKYQRAIRAKGRLRS